MEAAACLGATGGAIPDLNYLPQVSEVTLVGVRHPRWVDEFIRDNGFW